MLAPMSTAWYADRKNLIWAAIFCVIPLMGFWAYGLFDLDEGFYGAIARDMMRRNEWITPTLGGDPWFEKPILIYWLVIPAIRIFGEDIGPRLPSVLATLGLAFAIARWLKPKLGIDTAVSAAIVYGTSLLAVAIGRMFLTDPLLALLMGLCLMLFYDSCQGRPGLRAWSGLCLGLAILAKGPVAGVFFLLIAGLAYWLIPSMRPGYKKGWIAAILLCLAAVASWYVPCYLANGDIFVQKFLIDQNIGRFAGGDTAHALDGWKALLHPIYFPLILLLGLLPWAGFLQLKQLRTKPEESGTAQLRAYLWTWFWVILVFFSISGSKLPHYILPALAPLAMLAVESAFRHGLTAKKIFTVAEAYVPLALIFMWFGFTYVDRTGNADLHKTVKQMRVDHAFSSLLVIGVEGKKSDEGGLKMNETSHPSIAFYWPSLSIKSWRLDEALDIVMKKLGNDRPYLVVLTKQDADVPELARQARKYKMMLMPIRVESKEYRAFDLKFVGERENPSIPESQPNQGSDFLDHF
jgi:4-amino-4-deoxy-L-arabinose transferase-like glycosyltransferase